MGDRLVFETARLAVLLYVVALAISIAPSGVGPWPVHRRLRFARLAWTLGFLVYALHVAVAFHVTHGWSHAAAAEHVATRTAAFLGEGARSSAGLYLNHLFTLVWASDVIAWWVAPRWYARRPQWIGAAVHGYLGFITFQAVVVFAADPTRWFGIAATVLLLLLGCARRLPVSRRKAPSEADSARPEARDCPVE